MTRAGRLLAWLVLLLALGSLAAPAYAQDSKQLVWRRFDVDLNVQRDGRMLVTETQQIEFVSGTWQNGGRTIPLDRVDSISDVQVSELTPSGEQPVNFTSKIQGNDMAIVWGFPPASAGETRTFIIRYTANGVVRSYPDNQQLLWQAVPPKRRFPVNESTVTLTLPGSVPAGSLKLATYPARLGGTSQARPNGAVFQVADVPLSEGFEIRTQFPAGTVQAPVPAWQAEADRQDRLNQTVKPRNDVILLALGLLIPVAGLVGLLVLWYTRGKDPGVGADAPSVNTPPSDLPAPMVGVLLDERADVQDVVSALLTLSERGIVRITQVQNDKLLGSTNDFRLELLRPYEEGRLRSYERTLIGLLFGDSDSVMLSEVRGKFGAAIPMFRDQLYDEVAKAGLFRENPEKVRNRYKAWGTALIVLAVLFGCVGSSVLSAYAHSAFVFLPAVGLIVVGFGLRLVAKSMPVKTVNGAVEASRWRSFRNYLANIERTPAIAQDKGAFERYLSYATAFNIGRSWLEKFASVGTPAPPWYQPGMGGVTTGGYGGGMFGGPIIIMPPFGGYGGSGGGSGGAAGGGGTGASGGQDIFGNTGLFDFGDGRGALDKASGGFGDLLDQASDAFGGSDWGGGGGGGFGGGGGGGGADFS